MKLSQNWEIITQYLRGLQDWSGACKPADGVPLLNGEHAEQLKKTTSVEQ